MTTAPAPERQYSSDLLPDPTPRPRTYTVISVDDHVVEPPWMFEGRLPAKLAADAPQIVELDNGAQVWELSGERYLIMAMLAVAGRAKNEWTRGATRYDEMRPGCYQAADRVRDMDLDGVYASLNFPSTIGSFAGTGFLRRAAYPELGHALVRAWNDWYFDEWRGPFPDRFIGSGLTWLGDPLLAAAEVRRNAARGFTALSFPENPADVGLPPLASGHWDPVFEACQETETVVALHVGSSQWFAAHPTSPFQAECVLFPVAAARAAVEWVWSGVPIRFPQLQISLAEGGIGWVPMVLERMSYVLEHSGAAQGEWQWSEHPRDVLRRSFNFCALEFSAQAESWRSIGIDRVMVETDYPHADSSWPDTQELIGKAVAGFSPAEVRRVTWQNASRLYRHPVPAELQLPVADAAQPARA